MQRTILKGPRSACLAIAASALLTVAGGAHAQVFIVGNAMGCFGLGCIPAEVPAPFIDASGVVIAYTSAAPSDFAGVTAGGQLSIEGATGDFGEISVTTNPTQVSVSSPFTLLLSFLNPLTTSQTFEAVIYGVVHTLATGGILVDYDPAPGPANVNATSTWEPFFDPVSGMSGNIRVTAFGQPVPSGSTADLRGFIEVQVVPEPATMLLLGTGLAGLVGARRRRKLDTSLAA